MIRMSMLGAMLATCVVACGGAEPEPVEGLTPIGDDSPFGFPLELWDQGVEGSTVLMIHVDEAGRVDSVMIDESSGHEPFDEAAIEGARALRFEPARQGGRPVSTWARLPVRFSRDSAGIQAAAVPEPR